MVGEMCQAKIKGAEIGSTEVEFAPKRIRGGHYLADPHTAGYAEMVFFKQSVLKVIDLIIIVYLTTRD